MCCLPRKIQKYCLPNVSTGIFVYFKVQIVEVLAIYSLKFIVKYSCLVFISELYNSNVIVLPLSPKDKLSQIDR